MKVSNLKRKGDAREVSRSLLRNGFWSNVHYSERRKTYTVYYHLKNCTCDCKDQNDLDEVESDTTTSLETIIREWTCEELGYI